MMDSSPDSSIGIPPTPSAWREKATGVLRIVSVVLVVLILLPQGSVRVPHAALFTAAMAGLGAGGVFLIGEPRKTQVVHQAVISGLVLLLIWVAVQTVPLPGGLFGNPIWNTAGAVLGPLDPRITIQPADTQAASVFLALPLISFTTLLILNQGDEAAVRLIRQLAWVGGTVAAFAILQFQLFPETLLFGEKQAYIDSLTATFVNRNTAATFLGLTALALLVVLVLDGRSLKMAEVLRWLAGSHRRSRPKIGWRLPTTACYWLARSQRSF